MSMTVPPDHQQQPSRSRFSPTFSLRLAREWHHLKALPKWSVMLLVLFSLAAACLTPLLPLAAFLLQCWAASSWCWRDRWGSLLAFAWQGSCFVGGVVIFAWLSSLPVLGFPVITISLQTLWHTFLPGSLSLWPLGLDTLLARSLLLLPLAPALAVCYEQIDPRTGSALTRVLTPADLEPSPSSPASVEPEVASKKATSAHPPSVAITGTQGGSAHHSKKSAPRTPRRSPKSPQVTVDAHLSSEQSPLPLPSSPSMSLSHEDINWNDVME